MHSIRVHLLPTLTTPDDLSGRTVIVIDILRATTTIAHALAAGARQVIACAELDAARELARSFPTGELLLGGERDGLPPEGFDLGNSPSEYTPERVGGKTIVFTTTNGTQAMLRCDRAQRVYLGAFVNLSAICGALADCDNVDLLCAGTNGQITREDVLFAGAVVEKLTGDDSARPIKLNDSARLAQDSWRSLDPKSADPQRLTEALLQSRGGRNVSALGLQDDLATAAQIDRLDVVPILDLATMQITALRPEPQSR